MARTALVIDDLAFHRTRIRNLLRRLGYTVLEADNGEDGCRIALKSLPDVVFLDQVMHGLGGLETLSRMRAGGYPGVVFVLSPRPDGVEARAMLRAGAQGVVPKDAPQALIEGELRGLLGQGQAA
jgi:CheY-like chemotaxis protein